MAEWIRVSYRESFQHNGGDVAFFETVVWPLMLTNNPNLIADTCRTTVVPNESLTYHAVLTAARGESQSEPADHELTDLPSDLEDLDLDGLDREDLTLDPDLELD